ncbi:MAG TPA: hypothetical protein VGM11_05855 [Acidobacteriaceae bacterium]|jgi:hypothetical protein
MSTISPRLRAQFVKSGWIFTTLLSIALCGCSTLRVKLGSRVEIAKLPVASMEAKLVGDPGVAPGERSPLIVTFLQPDGTVLTTEGAGKGKVLWRDLVVSATLVSVNKKGVVSLAHDPRASDGKIGHLTITVPSHPGLQTELDVPVRYDYAFAASFRGADGNNGLDGTDGISGSPGSMGSMDPNNPSAGGDGGNGTNGSDGGNGGDGGDGPNVQVLLRLRPGNPALLQASVTADGHRPWFYLVDPNGGSLTVNSVGGSGGAAGRGGRGGSGGSGGIGTPSGNSGSSGMDGSDGRPGSDGSPGRITVQYDASAKPFLSVLHVPASATLQETSVSPPW